MLTHSKEFDEFINDRNEFSYKTFGSPEERDCTKPLEHLKKEVQELIEKPDDEME